MSPANPIVVREYEDSEPVRLSVAERDTLEQVAPALSIKSVTGSRDLYTLNPGHLVGAIQLNEMRFELRPKLAIKRLLFLLSYSLHSARWRDNDFGFEEEPGVFEAVVHGFASQLERALLVGPLQGSQFEEASLQTLRGRIRLGDHIRSKFGIAPPIECAFDEFTVDIEINRLLKAAIVRLGEFRLRSRPSRRRLRVLHTYFANVGTAKYDRRNIPEIRFDRRTEHYKGAVEFARLILRARSPDSRSGNINSASFLLNMASVFEDFVVVALREALGVGADQFIQHAAGRDLHLDGGRTLKLEPDLSWWVGSQCLFVGDVKYKRAKPAGGVRHPDVYQLLAYTLAARRPRGLLVYAASEDFDGGTPVTNGVHRITEADKVIAVRALDLGVPPDHVLRQIRDLAAEVRRQTEEPPHQLPQVVATPSALPA